MTTPSPVAVRSFAIDSAVMSADIEALQRVAVGTDSQPSAANAQFGGGQGTFKESGNLNVQLSAAGINPASTGGDIVLAVYSLPASSFDVANREVQITAAGSFPEGTNTKTVKIIFNATTAVVGSAVTGGTTVATTGAVTTQGGFQLQASVFKTGAAGSNTQLTLHQQSQVGGVAEALTAPQTTAAVESGPLLIAVTGNAATATANIVLNALVVAGAD
jgi:hypothetical protein